MIESTEVAILRNYFEGKKLKELYKEFNTYIVQKVLHSMNVLKYCFEHFDVLPEDIIYHAFKRTRNFGCDSLTWKSIEEIKKVGFTSALKICCYMLNRHSMSLYCRPSSYIYHEDVLKIVQYARKDGYLKLKWNKPLTRSIAKIVFTGVYVTKNEQYIKIIKEGILDYSTFFLNLLKVNLKPAVLQWFIDTIFRPSNKIEIPQDIQIIEIDMEPEEVKQKTELPVIEKAEELF